MKWQDFECEVSKHIAKIGPDEDYANWVANPVWKKFYEGEVTRADAEAMFTFLKDWGSMHRVVGQIRKARGDAMYSDLAAAVKNCQPLFCALRQYEFSTFDFSYKRESAGAKDTIEQIFQNLQEIIKHTSPAKLMHMAHANLFLMWDGKIRTALGYAGNAPGYFNFLARMRMELGELAMDYSQATSKGGIEALLADLNGRIGKEYTITKWLDVYNWVKYTKGGNL